MSGLPRVDPGRLDGVWEALDALAGLVTPTAAYHLALRVFFIWGLGVRMRQTPEQNDRDVMATLPTWADLVARADEQGSERLLAELFTNAGQTGDGDRSGQSYQGEGVHLPGWSRTADLKLKGLVRALEAVGRLGGLEDHPAYLYESCLGRFSTRLGVRGEYYTPKPITRLMANMVKPRVEDQILDPACGSGGFLIQAAQEVAADPARRALPRLFGLDINDEARQVAKMRLALHGLEADMGYEPVDTLREGLNRSSFDVVLANPPFNLPEWDHDHHLRDYVWPYGTPPIGNANFMWLQRILETLNATGRGAILLPSGAAAGSRRGEREIRRRLVEGDVVAALVALPRKIFSHTKSSACVWLLSNDKSAQPCWGTTSRCGQVLFIDAGNEVERISHGHRALSTGGVDRIVQTVSAWRGNSQQDYRDADGWCRTVRLDEIAARDFDLLPTRYVGVAADASNTERSPKIATLTRELYEHFELAARLEDELREILGKG